MSRAKELRLGDIAMSFGEMAKLASVLEKHPEMASKIDPAVMEKYRMQKEGFVVESSDNANGAYRIFRNGTLVAKLSIDVPAYESSRYLTFPIHFPNEVTGVQFVGDFTPKVKKLTQSGMELLFDPATEVRKLQIIVSGV